MNTGSWASSSEKRSDEEESRSTVGGTERKQLAEREALSSGHDGSDLRPRLSDIAP